jgi:MFS family permease
LKDNFEPKIQSRSSFESIPNQLSKQLLGFKSVLTFKTTIRIAIYTLFAFANISFTTLYTIWAGSSSKGMNLNPKQLGDYFSMSGYSKLIFQLFLYTKFQDLLGIKNVLRLGLILYIFIIIIQSNLSPENTFSNSLLILCLILNGISETFGYISILSLITESVTNEKLGIVHGVSSAASSLSRIIAPTFMGIVWELFNPLICFSLISLFSLIAFGLSFLIVLNSIYVPVDESIDINSKDQD